MNKDTTYTKHTSKPFDDSNIDYSTIDNMTDKEIHKAAQEDPDAQPQTKKELEQFKLC